MTPHRDIDCVPANLAVDSSRDVDISDKLDAVPPGAAVRSTPARTPLGEGRGEGRSGRYETDHDWFLWQLSDSAFPTGGFAHSAGLEAAWQHGEIRDRRELTNFVELQVHQAGVGALPFVNSAYHAPQRLGELDELFDVFTSNHVANRASRLQGQAFLASSFAIFDHAQFGQWRDSVERLPYFHYAPVFGACCRVMDVSHERTGRLFLFQHLRALLNAAVRLNIIGTLESQSLLHRYRNLAEKIWHSNSRLSAEQAAQCAPLVEIFQASQDRLYSRLFQS